MQTPPIPHDEDQRLVALHATGQLNTPIEERFEVITRMARRLFGVPIAAVSLVDANRQWFKSIQGLNAEESSRDISFCGHTIAHNDVLVINDAREDPRFADNPFVIEPPHIVFYAGCPIRVADGSNIATLCLIDSAPRQFSDEDIATLRDLTLMAQQQFEYSLQQSVASDLIGQIETEQRRALIDPLTRIWNRRGIDELLDRQLQECQSCEVGTAVIITDIDRFKLINDKYGHPIGDQVLREVAKRFLTAVRQCDSVGRHGGEEFLIIPGSCADPREAANLAERLRHQLCDKPINTDAGDISVTASFGVSYAPPINKTNCPALIRDADAALYLAKASGRNRVNTHAPTLSAA